ncbi:hypothetical protein C0991_008152 [Blastosporella zonata]|nr:hypothetical protein C0991_008152 [Blastosporella zonata]
MWDQRPEKLQDKDWTEEAAVMEAGQDLWTMWSLKEWAQEAPYNKFFSVAMVPGQRSVALANINMGDTLEMPLFEEDNKDFETSPVRKSYSTSEGLGKRKAAEISGGASMGSGPSNARPAKTSKTGPSQPSTKQAKVPVDILGAHATDKDSVDEGLEGDIAVQSFGRPRDHASSAPPPRWPTTAGTHRRACRVAAVSTAVSRAGIWRGTLRAMPSGGRAW